MRALSASAGVVMIGRQPEFNKLICCFLAATCLVSLSTVARAFDANAYRTSSSFELVVDKSKYLKVGSTKISARSAFVSLAHGLQPGNADGLEILFLTRPVTQADLADLVKNDAREAKKASYAAMVLFLDKEHRVAQVNLSYVVPGTTVARTVAWKPDELQRYFSNLIFRNGRVALKSKGTYSESEPSPEVMRLSWDVDLDLPVSREVKR